MKEEKRRRIMQAAEALFSRGRFHEITMDDVARKAGVGKGTIYRYFKDKDDLFFEIALSGHEELCEMVRTEGQRSSDFRDCLVRVCRRVSEFHRKRRQLIHMMQTEERRAVWQRGKTRELWLERRRELVTSLVQILQEGCRNDELRTDLPLDVLASFLLGMLRTRGRESRLDSRFEIDHKAVVELFLNGAAGRPTPEPT